MPSLYTQIDIDAPRSQVWQALVRKDAWMYWNTFLYDSNPNQLFEPGQNVQLCLRQIPGKEMLEFQAQIMGMQPEVWLGWRVTIPGLVSQQRFELQDLGRDRTRYLHQEEFSGTLARFIFPFIRQHQHQGIRRMARELKWFVEEQSRKPSIE